MVGEGGGWTVEQEEAVEDLFLAHVEGGPDGRMDFEAFKHAMIEGFAYSLSTQEYGPGLIRILRQSKEALTQGLPKESPAGGLLRRAFRYFDTQQEGSINLPAWKAGLSTAGAGGFKERCEFLFFVTDANGDGYLSEQEVDRFFLYFTVFFYRTRL